MNKRIFATILTATIVSASVLPMSLAFASFSDVNSTNIYVDAINYAQQNNIVSGYPDGTFKPNNTINRAEFTKIVIGAAYAYNPTKDTSTYDIYSLAGLHFSDVVNGQWYIPFLRKGVESSIIAGYSDGTFKPTNNINFAEASKIIVKGFALQTGTDAIWYKPYVDKLTELKAIPTSIHSFNQQITRGEMVEMIYRIKSGLTTKDSTSYAQINGTASTPAPSPSPTPAPTPSPTPTPSPAPHGTNNGVSTNIAPTVGPCQIFPADNPWNTDISNYPLDPNSQNYINSIGASGHLHPDFGGAGEYGIPYNVVGSGQAKVPLLNVDYADQSDPGPYPIPDNAKIEPGSDAHVLVIDQDACKLYELWSSQKVTGGWNAGSAAIFDLASNLLRPDGWTSADAAGLPVFAGLARYDEVTAGAMNHALRFTISKSQKGYIHPATHQAGSTDDTNAPPMGLRLRLKADYDISGFTGEAKVILETLKKYGMIVADNGSNWYISGEQNPGWNDDELNSLKSVPGSAFEVVQTGAIQH